jgi:GTPase SAR1 family protein
MILHPRSSNDRMSALSKKICILGDELVGDRSQRSRFVKRQLSDTYLSHVGVTISCKSLELFCGEEKPKLKLQLIIWDLHCGNKFKSVARRYLQGASGAVIVADVSRQETLARLSERIQLFLSVNPKGFIVIAWNQSDIVDEKELEELATQVPKLAPDRVLATYKTTAQTGAYADEIFQQLAYRIIAPA